jgi:hypothetical protein
MTDLLGYHGRRKPAIADVKSPVQADIPGAVKLVNVGYYWKHSTDIPSHFLLC